jgi:hypothetical protein
MTRTSAATAILICLMFSASPPALSQTSAATDNGCFPWQVFRSGQCIAKPAQEPPALPAPAASDAPPPAPADAPPAPPAPPVVASPCLEGGFLNSFGQCMCPASTHPDEASGRCVADLARAPETTRPADNIVCDGGTVSNGFCVCPSGFNPMPAAGTRGSVCARTNAENCLGGQLSVSGKCTCHGQVTMSGETYLLEYSNGKCLPMRCPVTAMSPDGTCGGTSPTAPSLASEPKGESKGRPAREARDTREDSDEGEHRRRCGRGMVLTRSGCAAPHRSLDDLYRRYYRNY